MQPVYGVNDYPTQPLQPDAAEQIKRTRKTYARSQTETIFLDNRILPKWDRLPADYRQQSGQCLNHMHCHTLDLEVFVFGNDDILHGFILRMQSNTVVFMIYIETQPGTTGTLP